MTDPDWKEQLSPPELVRATGRLSELGFVREYCASPLLAVRIRPGQDTVTVGLDATLRGAETTLARPMGALAFHTEVASAVTALPLMANNGTPASPDGADPAGLARTLETGSHYLVLLRKRASADTAFMERISIGRAPNKDIVLRHGSVSKFHAWFQLDERDTYYVADAGSKNGSTLNGRRLPPREPVAIRDGDQLVFGSVEAVFCDPRTFWKAMHV